MAAMNSYAVLAPSLVRHEYTELAKLTLLVSIYTLWLALSRISVVTEVLDGRNATTAYIVYARKLLFIASPSFFLMFFSDVLSLSKTSLLMVALLIFLGLQQELARQKLLSLTRYRAALIIDVTWLLCSSIFLALSSRDYEESLFSWLIGCVCSIFVAWFSMRKMLLAAKQPRISQKTKNITLAIPVILATFTIIQNIFLGHFNNGEFLGQMRAIQILFLPSIFLINTQQNTYVPLLTKSIGKNIAKTKRNADITIALLVLIGVIASHLYVKSSISDTPLSLLIFVIALSVMINYEINFQTIRFLVRGDTNKLVFMRLAWLSITSLILSQITHDPVVVVIILAIIDLVFLLILRTLFVLNSEEDKFPKMEQSEY